MPKSAPPRKAQSPAKAAARRAALKPKAEAGSPVLVVDGVRYSLDRGDLTPLDVVALRRATGMGLERMAHIMVTGEADVDVIAAFVWLSRRTHGEPGLTFEQVAVEMGMDATVEFDANGAAEDSSPEA